jgi:hypothetical protein
MSEGSYEFDPCSIDGSDKERSTLDSWKPTEHKPVIVASKWREQQIGDNFNQQPGIDELQKIHRYLKKKASDSDIMKAFGITAETLVAIKKDKYDPVEGISLDNQSKIYREFKRLEERIESLFRGIHYIGDCLYTDDLSQDLFKLSFKKPVKKSKAKKSEDCEVTEEICDQNDEFSEDFIELDEELDNSGEEE